MRRQTSEWNRRAQRISLALVIVGAAGLVLAPDAAANCGINKFFRSGGSDSTENVRILPGYAGHAPGTEIGRWWDSSSSALSSNFGPNDGTCPSSGWWSALMNGNFQIDGILDGPGCVGYAGCPGQEMTVVIEDYGPIGPPGIHDTAYFVGWRVDDTPASLRRYDYGRTDNGMVGSTTYPFLEFPAFNYTAIARDAMTLTVGYELSGLEDSVHTASGAGDVALPTDSVVAEWHLLFFVGTGDPGRLRSAGWTLIQTVPYVAGGSTTNVVEVDCPNTVQDAWFAVGLGFDGGAAGTIDSELVGATIGIECDPNLADPELPVKQRFERADDRPQPSDARPRSAGGRR
jgi:hypothetical protein